MNFSLVTKFFLHLAGKNKNRLGTKLYTITKNCYTESLHNLVNTIRKLSILNYWVALFLMCHPFSKITAIVN